MLNDNLAKSGVRASNTYSENKATCSSLCAEYDHIFGQPENELSLAWRQLSVKLGAAQSQLLQARDEDQYAMYRTTAARCKPVTKHLAVQTFVWYWLLSVLAEDVKFPSWLVTCLLCTQGLRRSADFNTINVSCPAFHIFLCSFCSDAL